MERVRISRVIKKIKRDSLTTIHSLGRFVLLYSFYFFWSHRPPPLCFFFSGVFFTRVRIVRNYRRGSSRICRARDFYSPTIQQRRPIQFLSILFFISIIRVYIVSCNYGVQFIASRTGIRTFTQSGDNKLAIPIVRCSMCVGFILEYLQNYAYLIVFTRNRVSWGMLFTWGAVIETVPNRVGHSNPE